MPHPPLARPYPIPPNELERLSALYAYDVLDTLPEPAFDTIAAMAARLFAAPISLVSLVDDQRQWFKAKCGFEPAETARDLSFCTHAMLEARAMVVCDATKDGRFRNNPLVTGHTSFRFYVGTPIKTKDGLSLGSLCVIDTVPRDHPAQNLLDNLADLASLVVEHLESRSAATAKLRAELRYKLIADTTNDLFLIMDENGMVVTVNQASNELLGYEPEEMIGKPLARVMPGFTLPTQSGVVVLSALHKSGIPVPLEVSFNCTSTNGYAYSAVARDLSEREGNLKALVAASNALRSNEARLDEVQRVAHLGYWERDLRTNVVSWSDGAYRVFGLRPQDGITFEQFQRIVPEQDRRVMAQLIEKCVSTGEPFVYTYQVTRGDGSIAHLESHGHVERDAAGESVKVLGTVVDITARVNAELLVQNLNVDLERRVEERTELLKRSHAALVAEVKAHEFTQSVVSGQNRILQKIAAGAPTSEIFDELLDFGTSESSGEFVGLLFLKSDEGEILRFVAGPRVADEVKAIVSSVKIGPNGSPAGAAAYHRRRVVREVVSGSGWAPADLLLRRGVRKVAAVPILGKDQAVRGAISFAIRGEPTEQRLRILDACASLAAVVLLRDEEQASLRLSEQTIREVEHRLRLGLGFARVAVWTWSATEDTAKWSGAVKEVFGVDEAELHSYSALREMMVPADREIIDRKIADSVRDGGDYSGEFRIVHPNGEIRWIAGMGGATLNQVGQVVQMSGVNFDITDRKLAEEQLALSELHFRELAESMPQMVWTANATGDFEYCNRKWHQVTGLPDQTTSQSAWLQVVHPDDAAPWSAARLEAHRAGRPCEMEFRLWDVSKQRYRWHLGRKEPVLDSTGQVTRWYGTCIDIHERKAEELKLAESERRLRKRDEQMAMIFDTGTIGDFSWDLKTDLVTAHPTVWKFFGKPDGHGTGPASWFLDRYHPVDADVTKQALQDAIDGKRSLDVEYRVVWPDGTIRWLTSVGVVVRDHDGNPLQMHGLGIDITERKTAELRILESERQLREQADAMPLIVWRSLPDGRIDFCNAHWENYTGYSVEETITLGWQSIVHPEDLPSFVAQSARGFASESPYSMEFRVKRASDGAYRWFLAQWFPFRDQNAKLLRWFGAGVDIDDQKTLSERLEAQVMKRTSELRRTVSEKETLLREVHHRVKNNLQVISSLLSLQERSMEESRAADALRESQQRVYSMALIHEHLYGGQNLEEIEFGEYARSLVQELCSSFRHRAAHVSIRFELSPVGLNIHQAIPCGLILNELATNALKYAYPHGQPGEILIGLSETEAGMVSLTVADQGVGLPEGFDWKKTKSMGLSIAHLLAQQIDGRLSIRANPGAAFTVEFRRQFKEAKSATA